jgi:hypothetical protein
MARKIRIEYAGAAYHVMARGNQGRDNRLVLFGFFACSAVKLLHLG